MNEKEKRARDVCAYCNFVPDCEACTHREWPSGRWYKVPRFNWKKCKHWRAYLISPIVSLFRKILCFMGRHRWYTSVNWKWRGRMERECTRCPSKQIYDHDLGWQYVG